jgi:citrate synthase
MAQWMELMNDPELKIARPRQVYTGTRDIDYVSVEER